MDEFLRKRKEELQRSGYKPTYLEVDEFAIHKGHSYASCVMDLETGEILWVGKGVAWRISESSSRSMTWNV
ncbi:MAG: hypothetical protein J6I35_02745 [Ruminobacter sp.]|uniref:hypothetical protein n=1 Tax=Ruminobacter sp. TaxID=2774296 RepID=UPI001B0A91D0|nr:hypothetical protein [Ruminobacter sp.]MBO6008845.1 hypothetical protein [Ruminobacter sp.]MBP3748462.1 hypothetical protein [Ruminobacter sp.]